jgi:SAM-dependent methyltransferase
MVLFPEPSRVVQGESMNPESAMEEVKQRVYSEWTDGVTVAAWRKWHPKMVVQSREATEALVEAARITQGLIILDIASGTGEPAFTLAEAVGQDGRVIATDLAAEMLAIAEENARGAGLTNLSFRQADAHALPFPDEIFDRVTCRFGVMYFADAGQALGEIRRVLRPGGLIALAAWGPAEQNLLAMSALGPFLKRVNLPPAPPESPNPFKFALEGSLSHELERAGFLRVREEARTITSSWPGSPEELWECIRGIANPLLSPIMDSLSPDERELAASEVVEAFRSFSDGQRVNSTAGIVLATGLR